MGITLNRSIPPAFCIPKEVNLIHAKKIALDNGVSVFSINAGTQEVFQIEFVFEAGSTSEDKIGVNYFASNMLTQGTSNKTSAQISSLLDFYGAHLDVVSGHDFITFSLSGINRHFQPLMALVSELLFDPKFPPHEFETLKNIKKQELQLLARKNSQEASRRFLNALYGDSHAYGQIFTPDKVDLIGLETDVIPFYQKRLKSRLFEIILSGKIEQSHLVDLNQWFGKLELYKQPERTQSKQSHMNAPFNYYEEREKSLQTSIRIGKVFISKDHQDYHKLKVLIEILGGYFGSRLMKNIREDKGYTYGIYAQMVSLKYSSFLTIGTEVKKESQIDTVDEIHKEIKQLQTEPVSADELETVKNYMVGSFLININTPFALARYFKSIYYFGLDYTWYDRYLNTIKNIQSKELLELANKYLNRDSMTEVKVG